MILVSLLMLSATPALAGAKKTIMFGDYGWDSIQVHNRIAAFIIEKGLGYPTDFVSGETIMLNTALMNGKGGQAPHINMESWEDNWQELYDKGIAMGKDPNTRKGFIDLGSNFPNSEQGWYVPRYIVEGDPARGIKASAPDLKSISDIFKYWELFKDPEDPSKGRFYTCIPGWECARVNEKKIEAYGLKKYFNIMQPGSGAALAASMERAYKQGKPWFGYYWAPTWVLGKLDMIRLEEPAYAKDVFLSTAACAYPSVKCNILVYKKLPEWAPEVVEMLKNYETSLDLTNEFLSHMKDTGASKEETAVWWLKKYQDKWSQWVSAEAAAKVKAALN